MKPYLLLLLSFFGLSAFGQDSLTVTANGCDIEVQSSVPRLSKTYDARTLVWDTIAGKVGSVRLDDGSTRDWFYASFLTNFDNRDSLFAFFQREQDSCRVYHIDSNVRIVGSLEVNDGTVNFNTSGSILGLSATGGAGFSSYGFVVDGGGAFYITSGYSNGVISYGAFYDTVAQQAVLNSSGNTYVFSGDSTNVFGVTTSVAGTTTNVTAGTTMNVNAGTTMNVFSGTTTTVTAGTKTTVTSGDSLILYTDSLGYTRIDARNLELLLPAVPDTAGICVGCAYWDGADLKRKQ